MNMNVKKAVWMVRTMALGLAVIVVASSQAWGQVSGRGARLSGANSIRGARGVTRAPSIRGSSGITRGVPSSAFRAPSSTIRRPSATFRAPSAAIRAPSANFRAPSSISRVPSSISRVPSSRFSVPSSAFRTPSSFPSRAGSYRGQRSPSIGVRSPLSGASILRYPSSSIYTRGYSFGTSLNSPYYGSSIRYSNVPSVGGISIYSYRSPSGVYTTPSYAAPYYNAASANNEAYIRDLENQKQLALVQELRLRAELERERSANRIESARPPSAPAPQQANGSPQFAMGTSLLTDSIRGLDDADVWMDYLKPDQVARAMEAGDKTLSLIHI